VMFQYEISGFNGNDPAGVDEGVDGAAIGFGYCIHGPTIAADLFYRKCAARLRQAQNKSELVRASDCEV